MGWGGVGTITNLSLATPLDLLLHLRGGLGWDGVASLRFQMIQ